MVTNIQKAAARTLARRHQALVQAALSGGGAGARQRDAAGIEVCGELEGQREGQHRERRERR